MSVVEPARLSRACRYQHEKLVAKSQAWGAGVAPCPSSYTLEVGHTPEILSAASAHHLFQMTPYREKKSIPHQFFTF